MLPSIGYWIKKKKIAPFRKSLGCPFCHGLHHSPLYSTPRLSINCCCSSHLHDYYTVFCALVSIKRDGIKETKRATGFYRECFYSARCICEQIKMGFSVLPPPFLPHLLHLPLTWHLMPPSDNTKSQALCQNYPQLLPSPQNHNSHFLSKQISVARHERVMSWSNPQLIPQPRC